MSQPGHTPSSKDALQLASGFEALQASPEFRGPVEPYDDHHSCNEHLALIYETREQQFAAVVPFIRQGLERGERCLYVVDGTSRGTVIDRLEAGGVDAEAAVTSGALSFHTTDETHLRNGEFDPDDMVAFYRDAIDEATEEYDALRVTAETGWILDESTDVESWLAYEAKVNDLFEDEECIALCQYDRNLVPTPVIRDLVKTHPHLVYDNTVCHNFYYTPPEEFFRPDEPEREVDRMLGTLLGRTRAKATLRERQRALRRLYRVTADSEADYEAKLQALFELGCERFDLEVGAVARVDPRADEWTVEHAGGDHPHIVPGASLDLSETFCRAVADGGATTGICDTAERELQRTTAFEEFGVRAYLGTRVETELGPDRTFFFASTEAREEGFTEAERTFHHLMCHWLEYDLARRQREEFLQRSYEITSDTDLPFAAKVDRLLEHGREWFGYEIGYLARADLEADSFEVVEAVGDHDRVRAGTVGELSASYCRKAIESDTPVSVNPDEAEGWADDPAYETYGLDSFLGTTLEVDGELYGTLCFGAETPRERPVSDFEFTFLDLMGEWVSDELESKAREERLSALNALARDLMDAETTAEASARVVSAAEETMDLPATAIALYDERAGGLRTVARTDDAAALLEATGMLELGDGVGWTAFVENETRRVTAPLEGAAATDLPPVTEVAVFPLGRHGVLVTGATAPSGFSRGDFDFAETVAANTRAAFDRAHREHQLQERETALQEQNETLERLTRVNDIIRSIDQALVQAASREEIERVVCSELAETGPYELAWIGDHDPVAQAVTPRERAGSDRGYVDGIEITTDGGPESEGPAGRAITTGEPQVVNNVLEDDRFSPWRQAALERGYHAVAALPLVYEGTLYGVLGVYAGQPEVFADLEQSVLAELADNIAYAINAVESKKALVSDEVTELEFTLDRDLGILSVLEATDCAFALETVVPRSDGELQAFFSTRGAPAETVLSLADELPASDVSVVSERTDEGDPVCLFAADLDCESVAATVLHHGGQIDRFVAADGTATITVHLAADAAIREFVEMFTSQYPSAELVAQRSCERSTPTPTEFRTALTERLTPRQLEVFQTAYYSGYFEQPRTRTGSEIAGTLDISQPTFNAHLRTAQRKLCRQLLEEESLFSGA